MLAEDDLCQLHERSVPQGRSRLLHQEDLRSDAPCPLAPFPSANRAAIGARQPTGLAVERADGCER